MTLHPLALTSVCLIAAADAPAPAGDAMQIQGSWVLVSSGSNGEVEVPQVRDVKMVFDGNEVLAKSGGMTVSMGTFKLDPAKSPKHYDRTYPDGSPRRGIYKLEDGTLTICIAELKKDRPTAFETKQGDGCTLLVYKRDAP